MHPLFSHFGIDVDSNLWRRLTVGADSLLVHAVRDERHNLDCVYLFTINEKKFNFDPLALDLIIPQLDAALRRVKCLKPAQLAAKPSNPRSIEILSEREQEVLHWVSQGKSNEEIGTILGISHNTVKNHLKRIFNKMGVTARSQAVSAYIRSGASTN
jgi:DNA-binding CsgD family transcriptional regulator